MARLVTPASVETDTNIKILNNFEGCMIGPGKIIGQDIFLSVKSEQITCADGLCHDYGYHFSFGLENTGSEPMELNVYLNCRSFSDVPATKAMLYASPSLAQDFSPFSGNAISDRKKKTALRLTLSPGEKKYLANYFYRPYRALAALFDALAEKAGGQKNILGQTVNGRDLVCYHFPSKNPGQAGAILVTSGFHPPESDTIVTEAILKRLADSQWRSTLQDFDLYMIPMANPDGFATGTNAANGAQVNFQWRFLTEEPAVVPEGALLWKLAEKIKPMVYIDYHGYTFQMDEKHASPYLKPLFFYSGKNVRSFVNKLNNKVMKLTGSHKKTGPLTYAPSTFFQKLTDAYNTITFAKYHVHLMEGVERCRTLGISVFETIIQTFKDENFQNPKMVLKWPYGQIKKEIFPGLLRRFMCAYHFQFKPMLKKFI